MTRLKNWEFWGIGAVSVIAILLGLIFLNFEGNIGIFANILPATDSLWDISKLLFTSILIYAIVEYFVFGREYDNFVFSKAVVLIVTPVIFMASSFLVDFILNNSYTITHVILFFGSIAFGQLMSYYFMQEELYFRLMNVFGVAVLVFAILFFASYTIRPTLLPIFEPMNEYEEIITR